MKRRRLQGKHPTPDGIWQVFQSSGGGDCIGKDVATIHGLTIHWHDSTVSSGHLQRSSHCTFNYMDSTAGTQVATLTEHGKLVWSQGAVWVRQTPAVPESQRSRTLFVHGIDNLGRDMRESNGLKARTWILDQRT